MIEALLEFFKIYAYFHFLYKHDTNLCDEKYISEKHFNRGKVWNTGFFANNEHNCSTNCVNFWTRLFFFLLTKNTHVWDEQKIAKMVAKAKTVWRNWKNLNFCPNLLKANKMSKISKNRSVIFRNIFEIYKRIEKMFDENFRIFIGNFRMIVFKKFPELSGKKIFPEISGNKIHFPSPSRGPTA